jgi:hypothetical protein
MSVSNTSENPSLDKNNATVAPDAPVPIEKTEKRIVQLDEMNAADRALAEQFGYQPVCLM